jgi:hypothetical protein
VYLKNSSHMSTSRTRQVSEFMQQVWLKCSSHFPCQKGSLLRVNVRTCHASELSSSRNPRVLCHRPGCSPLSPAWRRKHPIPRSLQPPKNRPAAQMASGSCQATAPEAYRSEALRTLPLPILCHSRKLMRTQPVVLLERLVYPGACRQILHVVVGRIL